jgi:hypothetical protein
MSKQNEVTIIVTNEEQQQFNQTIVRAIKLVSEASEGTKENNYPIITGLCDLLQKIN